MASSAPPSPARREKDPNSPEQVSAEVMNAVIGNIFSTRRPRDVCAGAASACKSIARGFALGVAALVAGPVAGAYSADGSAAAGEEGEATAPAPEAAPRPSDQQLAVRRAKAIAAGVAVGVCSAMLLPLTGVVVGCAQVCRGLWNTPTALYHCVAGDLEWDAEARVWKEREAYVLAEDAAAVRREAEDEGVEVPASLLAATSGGGAAAAAPGAGAARKKRKVASLEYYDLLEIPPDASGGAVKKAYYKCARVCHPDKCGNDPAAHDRFQALSHAYQVLSDPQLRAAYDRDGASATAEIGHTYDAAVFFAALFGSQRFEAWVGELALAQISSTLTQRGGAAEAASKAIRTDEATGEKSAADAELGNALAKGLAEVRSQNTVKQRGREVGLATTLAAALEPYVEGRDADFKLWCDGEAADLAEADGGDALTQGALLLALARGYTLAADEWLGRTDGYLGLGGALPAARLDAQSRVAYARAASAGARGLYAAKKLSEMAPKGDGGDEVEIAVDDAAPATRDELAALGVGALKRLARANDLDVSGCVEKSHLVDALVFAAVAVPRDPAAAKDEAKASREDAMKAGMQESMPIFLEAMLRVSLVDVHDTLRRVVAKVLADEALDVEQRRRRAHGLKRFGDALFDAKRLADKKRALEPKVNRKLDAEASTRRVEAAVNQTMAAAMGQEMSEPDPKPAAPAGEDSP